MAQASQKYPNFLFSLEPITLAHVVCVAMAHIRNRFKMDFLFVANVMVSTSKIDDIGCLALVVKMIIIEISQQLKKKTLLRTMLKHRELLRTHRRVPTGIF